MKQLLMALMLATVLPLFGQHPAGDFLHYILRYRLLAGARIRSLRIAHTVPLHLWRDQQSLHHRAEEVRHR